MPKRDYYDDPAAPKANSIVVAVTAAVRNAQGELLLIERTDNGLWALPGGAQDIGESVVQAARREVREETGIDVEITGLSGISSTPGTSSPTTTARYARNSHSASTPNQSAGSRAPALNPARHAGSHPIPCKTSRSIHRCGSG